MRNTVLYAEMSPKEFVERIATFPVAYLPLGTLEWHNWHLPLGADGLQSEGLFRTTAEKIGGIVLPMLFLGPDFRHRTDKDGRSYYGMDVGSVHREGVLCDYPDQQFPGSAYYVSDAFFHDLLYNVLFQLKRAGFQVVAAHGHGPSSRQFSEYAKSFEKEIGIACVDCITDINGKPLPFQSDHAASNETSIMMALRPELVDMAQLPADIETKPIGMIGKDPRTSANIEYGQDCLLKTSEALIEKIKTALASISKKQETVKDEF